MREQKETDFPVELPGVGRFMFARRTIGDALKIRAELIRLTDGQPEADAELTGFANMIATIKVLCSSAPKGWRDVEKIDLLTDEDGLSKLIDLYEKVREQEDSFRKGSNRASAQEGSGAGE